LRRAYQSRFYPNDKGEYDEARRSNDESSPDDELRSRNPSELAVCDSFVIRHSDFSIDFHRSFVALSAQQNSVSIPHAGAGVLLIPESGGYTAG
jgi:hypothetical protein